MAKWYDVKYDYPEEYILDRIKYERKIRDWFMENDIDEWNTLRNEHNRMLGYSFQHKRDATLFTLKWT